MKKLMLLSGLFCLSLSIYAAPVSIAGKNDLAPVSASQRAKAHFELNYKDVSDASWYNAEDNSMYCIFQKDNTVNRVFYDEQGYWRFTLISYQPSVLNDHLKEIVSNHFEGYHISYVNEVRSEYEEPVYMINIENAGNIKVIKIVNDDIEVKQDLIKE
jgi:hypothetical protein